MSKARVRASTSPTTPNAPTTCEFSRGHSLFGGRAQNYGLSTYPAMLRPLRGSSASWGPFFRDPSELDFVPAPMVNRVLTSPYLWWFDPYPTGLTSRSAARTNAGA